MGLIKSLAGSVVFVVQSLGILERRLEADIKNGLSYRPEEKLKFQADSFKRR
jgi:hypothetical protein